MSEPEDDLKHTNTPLYLGQKFAEGFTREHITPLDRVLMMQWMSRTWRKYLAYDEIPIMFYILDRTVNWGYPTFKACHRNVLEGTDKYAGLGIPRRTYLKILKSLELKQAITRIRSRDYVILGLNFDWSPDVLPLSERSSD